jgi:fumarate reductase flavoprotein subunit
VRYYNCKQTKEGETVKRETRDESLIADIVIVGGGGSGLAAAAAALEKGATSIIIVEKLSKLGGNAVNPGGIFGADTDLERRLGQDVRKDDAFRKCMDYAHWKINGRLVRTLIERSSDTIRWLEGKGITFVDLVAHYHNQVPNAYHVAAGPGRTGAQVVQALSKQCNESSAVRILCNTPAMELLRNGRGAVAGVVARTKEGKSVSINAKSVIVCTGGFAGNEALIKKYDPSYNKKEIPPAGIPHQGDGVRMASEIGAALDGMVVYEWGGFFAGTAAMTIIARRYDTIWINKKGERYFDEGMPISAEMANALCRQPGRVMYCLFDEGIKKSNLAQVLTSYEVLLLGSNNETPDSFPEKIERDLKTCVKNGSAKISRSWKEIAEWTGIKPAVLKATVEDYNSFCDRGHDDYFAKDRLYLTPLRKPPYYAMRCTLRMTAIHGGIKINHRMEALDKEDDPIPGLYAAGIETGATEWDSYNMGVSGHAFGFAINSGRIAGEEAVKYVLARRTKGA